MISRLLLCLVSLFLCVGLAGAQPAPASQPEVAPASQPPGAAAPPSPPSAGAISVAPAAGPHEAAVRGMAVGQPFGPGGLVEEDLDVEKVFFRWGGFSIAIGGMIQVQGAFYVGDGSSIKEKDPADTEGFRVRRARFGLAGYLIRDFAYYLAVDLKDAIVASLGGDRGSELLDAKIEWQRFPWLRVSAGLSKVPFSTFSLQSSARLLMIERPLVVQWLTPEYRAGVTVEGRWHGLQYGAGLFNGSEGVTSGNKLAGVAGAFRAQYTLFEERPTFVPRSFNATLGAAYMIDNGPSVLFHRVAAGLGFRFPRGALMGEFLWVNSIPHDVPTSDPEAGEVRRWGVAGEAGVFVFRELLQLAARYEYFRDSELATFGRQQLISGGLNVHLYRDNLKLQVNYTRRDELSGPEVPNDIGFAQVQAMF